MKKLFVATLLSIAILCCKNVNESKTANSGTKENIVQDITQNDTYFQYNIWWAFVNRVFDTDLSVKSLKQHGDVGLGSFNLLDGEMIMVDGIVYRIRENGEITQGADKDKIVYANAAFYKEETSFEINEKDINVEVLKTLISKNLPSKNFFYAFQIKAKFKSIKCGGLTKQDKPFDEGLDTLIPNRPIFEGQNVSGTIIGFYCPKFIGNINVEGFHFHFISDDKKLGGHVMDFKSEEGLTIGMDKKTNYHFYLPENKDFETVGFEKEFQYVNEKK